MALRLLELNIPAYPLGGGPRPFLEGLRRETEPCTHVEGLQHAFVRATHTRCHLNFEALLDQVHAQK